MTHGENRVTLLHVTTAPQTLHFLTGQAAFLQSRGIEVCALSSPGWDLDAFGRAEHVPVYAVEMTRRLTPFRDLIALGRLWRQLRRIRPTVVHAHTPKGGLLAMIAASLAGTPLRIYHVHGLPLITKSGLTRQVLRWAESLSCRLSHQVLCVSESVRGVVVDERLCREDRIRVPGPGSINGIDALNRFRPEPPDAASGESVRRARLKLLEEGNPLGLVYDTFALASLAMVRAV